MKLAYKAYDSQGRAVTGIIECPDVTAATETLRQKGLYVTQVTESEPRVSASGYGRTRDEGRGTRTHKLRGSQRIKNLAVFTRQLAVLIFSGTRLPEALSALERQTKPGPWQDAICDVRSRVEQGASLSEAMEGRCEYFDSIYCSLIAAGESTGQLVEMLNRLAALKQKQLQVRRSIVGALTYPSLLMVVAVSILPLLFGFVLPRFAMLFDTLDVPLPGTTKILVHISAVFRSYWWAVILFVICLISAAFVYLRTADGNRFCDTAILRIPYIGNITKSLATARIVRLLGLLMGSHVPVLTALELIKHTAGNVHYAELISKALEHVARGEPLSLAFSNASLISPSVYESIRSGEQSGQIERLSLNIADFLDDENEVTIRSLTSIIEPVILLAMAILVGLIAISIFTPLFDLTAMTQAGAV